MYLRLEGVFEILEIKWNSYFRMKMFFGLVKKKFL